MDEFVVVVGKVVEDKVVEGMFVGIMVDSVTEVFGLFVVGKVGFEEWARQLRHVDRLGIPIGAFHGLPCQPLILSFSENYCQISLNY
jgi:hypothetical protein